MKRGEWHARARRLQAKGYSTPQIAKRIGVTTSAVYKALDPERAKRYWDKDNAEPARKIAKRDCERRAVAHCSDCGHACGPGSAWKGVARCKSCHIARVHRVEQYAAAWAAGLTLAEISDRFGLAGKHIAGQVIGRYRELGYDFPHRRSPQDLANIRAGYKRWRATNA